MEAMESLLIPLFAKTSPLSFSKGLFNIFLIV